jgi:ATP-binding protein involved in chromosome partitioning
MRIAIPTAQGTLCPHFGHCEQFAIVDVDEGKIVQTEYQTPPPHEPGVLPAWLHELGANVIICGGMGMRAQQLFAQNDIQVVYGAPSLPAEEVIRAHLDGKLVTGDNICDH